MPRKPTGISSTGKSKKPVKTVIQNLPHHHLAPPFSRLQSIGPEDGGELYSAIAEQLKQANPRKAAEQLLTMVQDESYYDYDEGKYEGGATGDARSWTRLHSLRVLARMGAAATIGIEPLISLLNTEDDYLREEAPFYYAEMGLPALEPLARILADANGETYSRAGAGESLAEIAEKHPQLRERVVPILEQALLAEKNDDALNGFLIASLCDLAAVESMSIIEAAFKEDRVDDTIVSLAEVQEHFGLEITAERPRWEYGPGEPRKVAPGAAPAVIADTNDPENTPFIAPEKVGRNEPCPCGSGKKFKKCCGT